MKLRIDSGLWDTLLKGLGLRCDVESAGLLFVETMRSTLGEVLVVRRAFPVPEEAYSIRRHDQLRLDPIVLNRLVRPARDGGLGIFTIHTHPGASTAVFSHADDQGDARLLPSFATQIPDAAHGSIVTTETGSHVSARLLASDGRLQRVRPIVVGRRITSLDSASDTSEPAFSRQVLALGERGQAMLRNATIGVIGAGGTGSVVTAQLAHMGVGRLLLVDADRVESSNVSRVLGATLRDVGLHKTVVVGRYVRQLGFPVDVLEVSAPLTQANSDQLRTCDVIVSCVDRHSPRAILNRLAYDALTPVIDIGTAFRFDPNGRLVGDAGRTIVVGPGRPCLACWGALDPERLRVEALSAGERTGQAGLGYVEGIDIPAPAVMPFNVMVAGAACVEVLRIVAGFAAGGEGPDRLSFSFSNGSVRRTRLADGQSIACRVCAAPAVRLRGAAA